VAKLFARHMDFEEQKAALSASAPGPPHVLAVGTPNRVAALCADGALKLSHCQLLLLDVTAVDVKGFNVVTMLGVREDFWKLYRDQLHERVVKGSCKVALF